jgi:hypothetical protein
MRGRRHDGAWFVLQFRAAEREEHAADQETKRGDLDTEGGGGLSGNQQQDARHQRDDEEHEGLTGTASVRLGRREPRAIDRDSDEQQSHQHSRGANNRDPVVAPSLDVEGHRVGPL